MSQQPVKDLEDFLVEAELQHYYNNFKDDLKVKSVPQLKYVEEEDLVGMGMTKPEIRRFKKFFRKQCPQGTFSKLRKILTVNITKETNGLHSPPLSATEKSPQPRPSNKTIIPEEAITLLKTLGTGEFGTVQQGLWLSDSDQKTQVAVKCLSRDKIQTGMPDFLKEATIMQTIDHDNIVRLYGVVLGQDALMLVTELAPLRSLLECLKDPLMRSTFPVLKLCEFAIQVCDGMSYLENKRFIHRDLAARNILVFSKDKVKLSDFGLSRALGVGKDYYQTNFNINLKLPIAWCAPECINYLRFTSSSDVWAFGVALWEMFTYGQQPWANLTGQQDGAGVDYTAKEILDAIDEPSFQRLEPPECCPRDFYDVMLKCWEHDPESRPKFTELLLMLPQIKPERVQAKRDGPLVTENRDFLPYQQLDIITVLDKRPEQAPEEDMWKGALDSGKTGYFSHQDTATYLEIKSLASPGILRNKTKLVRRESSRKSSRSSKKLDVTMISGPQDDLRHTGHIGYDGAVFGDVSFIGNNYNKLPPNVGPNGMTASVMSLPKPETDSELAGFNHSQSDACILNSVAGLNTSVSQASTSVSQPSASSNECVTDSSPTTNTSTEEKYEDLDDFDCFKMPELSVGSSFDLGLGGSLMDEVMKALTVSESRETTPVETDNLTNEKSPLLEKDAPFYSSKNTFDNVAMATDKDGEISRMDSFSEVSRSQELARGSPTKEPVLPELHEKKKKPKLRIDQEDSDNEEEQIPGLGSRQKGMRTLSESEERQMDEAIELANSYAMKKQASDHMISTTPSPKSLDSQSDRSHGDSDGNNSSVSSPKVRSVFNLRKKSPKQERKTTFTDEIASISDASEEVSAEAQEAYNMLIVRGSIKESRSGRPSLDKRGQRDQDSSTETIEKPALVPRANRNIRAPHIPGIPGRRQEQQETSADSNPLRRLREGVSIIPPKTRPKPGGATTDPPSPTKPNLSANRSFFDKLKEQELSQDSGEGSEEGINPVPLPPRTRSIKSSAVAPPTKPRQRKYPLDLRQSRGPPPSPIITNSSPPYHQGAVLVVSPGNTRSSIERELASSDLNSSHESSDSVFSSSSQHSSSLERRSLQGNKPVDSPLDSPFSVKSVTLTARDLGYQDTADLFWTQPVSLEDLGSNHTVVIPGRYKTSDTVSYEDLLEFALDGVSERESEQDICDEVRLMRKVLSKDVTIEDCMYCLEDTQWEVNNAIKLVKLKQLLSTNLADKERCKEVLMKYGWDVQEAANYLLQHPPGLESPELVHV